MKDFKYDIIAAGHICLDISPGFIETGLKRIDEILMPGKLINLNGVTLSAGGAVANTGFALKKLGMQVKPIANIGNDLLGRALNEVVYTGCNEQVDLNDNISTSYSIVLSLPNIDRIILHDPAGNNEFDSSSINYDEIGKARLFHFGYPPLMKKIYADGGKELTKIFKMVKDTGVTTSLDMSLPDINSESGKVIWKKVLEETLPFVDIFLPSIEEALFILDMPEYLRVKERASSEDFVDFVDLSILSMLGERIINMGSKIAVIKCGSKGIYVKSSDSEILNNLGNVKVDIDNWGNKEFFEETYKVHNFKSALAAGDTTIAGFLASMLTGMDIYETAKIACKTGALCCEQYDSISGLLKLDEIIDKTKSETEKNNLTSAPDSFNYNEDKEVWEIKR